MSGSLWQDFAARPRTRAGSARKVVDRWCTRWARWTRSRRGAWAAGRASAMPAQNSRCLSCRVHGARSTPYLIRGEACLRVYVEAALQQAHAFMSATVTSCRPHRTEMNRTIHNHTRKNESSSGRPTQRVSSACTHSSFLTLASSPSSCHTRPSLAQSGPPGIYSRHSRSREHR